MTKVLATLDEKVWSGRAPLAHRRSDKSLWHLGIIRILVLLLGILHAHSSSASSSQIGSSAPFFELPDAHGGKVRLDDFRAKVLLLNFWAPWCHSCRLELQLLESLHRKYSAAGLQVIGIGEDTSESGLLEVARRAGLSFLVFLDKDRKVADAFRVSGLPASFIIDRTGIIRYRYMGFGIEFQPLYEKEIEELLKQ